MPSVLIVDDHVAVRAGLHSVLRLAPSIDVVGAVPDAPTALAAAERRTVDVALVDYQLPSVDGVTLCRSLKETQRSLATLLYTAYDLPGFAVVSAVAGLDGVLGKGAPAEAVIAAIEAVAGGECRRPEPTRDAVRDAGRRLPAEDLALLGMRLAGTPEHEVADALSLSSEELGQRIDAMVERLRPRPRRAVPSPAYGDAEGEDGVFPPSERRR
jgi:two-component system response regulator DesR